MIIFLPCFAFFDFILSPFTLVGEGGGGREENVIFLRVSKMRGCVSC